MKVSDKKANHPLKISIITACYNSEKTLVDTIESVLAQTYLDHIEYIIVDGDSKDKTVDIIKLYEHQFNGKVRWISEKDNGIYDAMNKGILMATGDVIALINSDDLFCNPRAIEKIACLFKMKPELESVYADLYYVSKENTKKIVRRWVSGKQKKFRYGWHPAHPTFYIRRSVYEKYGLFNLDFKLAADFEIMLRFIECKNITTHYFKEPLVKMRLGGATNKNCSNIYNQNKECLKAFKINGVKVNKWLYPIMRVLPKVRQFIIN